MFAGLYWIVTVIGVVAVLYAIVNGERG